MTDICIIGSGQRRAGIRTTHNGCRAIAPRRRRRKKRAQRASSCRRDTLRLELARDSGSRIIHSRSKGRCHKQCLQLVALRRKRNNSSHLRLRTGRRNRTQERRSDIPVAELRGRGGCQLERSAAFYRMDKPAGPKDSGTRLPAPLAERSKARLGKQGETASCRSNGE